MKKTIFATLFAISLLFTANTLFAQETAFAEADVFVNVDSEQDVKSAFEKSVSTEGAKCWRWYYRPTYYRYTWRPAYYRPYYCYYRYYCVPYCAHFSWTTVTTTTVTEYKGGGGNNGALLDSEPTGNSPLKAKGLRKGDIITAIDGKPIKSLQELANVTANTQLTVSKGNTVKFAGNLLKSADESYVKSIGGTEMQEVEAGTLYSKSQVESANMDMYTLYDKTSGPVFGVEAINNDGVGVKVSKVLTGMPGEKTGFEVGDVILEINGQKITSEQDYSDAVDRAGLMMRVKLIDCKTNQQVEADVTLNK